MRKPKQSHELQILIPINPVAPPEGEGNDPIDYAEREDRPLLAVDERIAEYTTDYIEALRGIGAGRARLELRESPDHRGRQMRPDERDVFVAGVLAGVASLGLQLDVTHGIDEDLMNESLADLAGLDVERYLYLDDEERALSILRDIRVEWSGATWTVGTPGNEGACIAIRSKPKPWDRRR